MHHTSAGKEQVMSSKPYPLHSKQLTDVAGSVIRDRGHSDTCKARCGHWFGVRYQWPNAQGKNAPKVETNVGPKEEDAFARLREIDAIKRNAKRGGAPVQSRDESAHDYIVAHVKSRKSLAPRSVVKYLGLVKKYLPEDFPITELTPWRMRKIVNDMREDGAPEKDISHLLATVRQASKVAIADRLIDVDPTLGIEVSRTYPPARDIPTRPGVQLMWAAATPLGRDLLTVAIGTGLRYGEILGLTRKCYHGDFIRVSEQWDGQKYVPLKSRKEGDYRDIPITPQVREVLERRFAEGDIAFPIVYKSPAYAARGGYRPMNREHMNAEIAVFRSAVGDHEARYTWHSFRHYFASEMLAARVDIAEVGKWLGHANIQITYYTYMHLIQPQFDRMVDIMATAMDAVLSEPLAA